MYDKERNSLFSVRMHMRRTQYHIEEQNQDSKTK